MTAVLRSVRLPRTVVASRLVGTAEAAAPRAKREKVAILERENISEAEGEGCMVGLGFEIALPVASYTTES